MLKCTIQEIDTVCIDLVDRNLDYRQAMAQANTIAQQKLEDSMLLSWYDRDRDFESPQHSSECHADSAIPGYVDYGVYHGACLKIDFQSGRFVFFYRRF
jgi:hypothetical protein